MASSAPTSEAAQDHHGRAAALVALMAAVAAVVAVASGLLQPAGERHTLRASFASTINLVEDHPVRLAGRTVGRVESIRYDDGRSVVTFSIEDDAAWPLRRGTQARIRFGSTTAYADRYLELQNGPRTGAPLPDGAVVPPDDVLSPVEFDQMSRILDRKTRPRLQGLVQNGAIALDGHADNLGPGLGSAGRGLDQTASLLAELGADRAALRTLVVTAARASGAVAREERALRELVSNAAATFDEFADHSAATDVALARAPTTLRVSRQGLGRLDRSLVSLDGLIDDIGPGARRLARLAPVVRRVITTLRRVSPLASSALRRARLAAPKIREFLRTGSPFLERFGTASEGLGVIFSCIRPYAPELVGFLGTWPGWYQYYDARGHYARAQLNVGVPVNNGTPLSSEQVVANNPGIRYAFPRPPGLNEDDPWFIPECGVGRESLDPAKDPEAPGREERP